MDDNPNISVDLRVRVTEYQSPRCWDTRSGMDHSLWIKQTSNQVQFLEAMVQEPLLSPHMCKQGFLVGVPFTLEAVHETTQWADIAYLTVGTDKSNMTTAIFYALDQHHQGRKFILEVPYDLIRWESQHVKALLGKSGIHWNTCDQRQYGANRRKLTCLIFNLEPKMLALLFTKCDNKATGSKEKSTAQPFLGRWPRYRQLRAMLLATEVNPGDQPALTVEDGSFLTDVLELGLEDMAAPAARLCSLADFQSLLTWTVKTTQQNTGIGLPWPMAFEATTEPMKPHLFKDAPVAKLIKATDQLPPSTELCLHLDRSETVAAFIPLVRYLRQRCLPYQHFTGCSILRGTFGHRISLLHLDEPSAVFMWKHNSSTNQLYISSAAALSFPPDTFSIQEWSVVMFCDEQNDKKQTGPRTRQRRHGDGPALWAATFRCSTNNGTSTYPKPARIC